MKEILKLSFSLTLICAIAGAALAFVSAQTYDHREQARIEHRNEKMLLLLPPMTAVLEECPVQELPDGGRVSFFQAKDAAGRALAFCAEASDPSGFGGEIKVLVGLELDGTVRGVLVSENSETPGIGSRACERHIPRTFWSLFQKTPAEKKDPMPPNVYLDRFAGQCLPADGFAFSDEKKAGCVKPVSGATVTSRAVLHAVNRVCQGWQAFAPDFSAVPENR